MKLKYISNYLSIKQFNEIELNDFAVITGINGAGKSHLLNAIDKKHIKIEDVESENIILYNYNDFNIVNIDFNQNNNQTSELKTKQQVFQNKSNIASQKFNEQRNKILNSFNINKNYGSIYLNDDFINITDFFGIRDWSEDDKKYYQNFDINNPDPSYKNYEKILNFHNSISIYQMDKIDDLNKFIEFLNYIIPKLLAFNVIKNYNYNKELKIIDENKFQETLGIVISNPQFDFWSEENRNKHSSFILDFIESLTHFSVNLENINPQLFVKNIKEVYKEIESFFKKQIDEDTLKQIQSINGDNVLDNVSFDSGFFNLNDIAQEEKNFQIQKKSNEYNKYLKSTGEIASFFTEEEFYKNFGESPIKILNDVLNEYDVNGYEFKSSELHFDFHNGVQNQNIQISLFNKKGNFQTNLEFLSSGEKTLLALAFYVFKLKKKKTLAKVLLMDEQDSALHPLMSKRLVNVLYNYFHKTLGIKIITTSHSPSSIAFAPNESLYIMKKGDSEKLLHHVSKDEALKELTIGVPSFSINYENRKQVFVESKYDVEYYSALYDIFKNYLNNDISLNFIASGDVRKNCTGQGISSCDVVKSVTQTLREAGNNSIYGIIDWDLAKSKEKNPYIITLGFNSRYSIENFILDPLFIGLLLIIEKIKNPEYFDLKEGYKIKDIYNISLNDCQKIINKIENDFLEKTFIKEIKQITYLTVISESLSISDEIAKMQGHKLEENYYKMYPELNKFKGSADNHFKNYMIKKLFDDFTEYLPLDLLEVLKDVQK